MASTPKTDQETLAPILAAIPISSLKQTPLGKVAELRTDQTIDEAIRFLHAKNILSAPVVSASAAPDADWQERYVALVDVIQLCCAMIEAFAQKPSIPEANEDEEDLQTTKIAPLPSSVAKCKLQEFQEDDAWFPFLPIEEKDSLLDAVQLLGTLGLKRLPVINANGEVCNMITQSSIMHQLVTTLPKYELLANKTLEELGLGAKQPVYSIRRDQHVKDAFEIIAQKKIGAVPVLGSNGELIGNISARHIYYALTASNKFRLLHLTAAKFLQRVSDVSSVIDIKSAAITCKANDQLGAVMQKMDAAKIHRIYVADSEGKPMRVLALSDILNRFATPTDDQPCQIL